MSTVKMQIVEIPICSNDQFLTSNGTDLVCATLRKVWTLEHCQEHWIIIACSWWWVLWLSWPCSSYWWWRACTCDTITTSRSGLRWWAMQNEYVVMTVQVVLSLSLHPVVPSCVWDKWGWSTALCCVITALSSSLPPTILTRVEKIPGFSGRTPLEEGWKSSLHALVSVFCLFVVLVN